VTIDGAGYRIHGGGPPAKGSIGIRSVNFHGLRISNVTIVWFKNAAIRTFNGDSLSVDNVQISVNGTFGVQTRDFA
jgi:hypothetical protein